MDLSLLDDSDIGSIFNLKYDFFGDGETTSASQIMNIPTHTLFKVENVDQGRFGAPVSEKQLADQKRSGVPLKTRQNNNWAKNIWKDWTHYRNNQPQTFLESNGVIPEDMNLLSNEGLNLWMQRFIVEIRRKDGTVYPPNTLTQITAAIQRYLRHDCDRPDINFFKDDDRTFAGFRQAIDSKMKELTAQGIGLNKKSSDPVTADDEEKMWDTGVFSMETAEGLSNAIFFYNGESFGFRGMEGHKTVQAERFKVGVDADKKRKFVKYARRISKNVQGGLKHRNVTSLRFPWNAPDWLCTEGQKAPHHKLTRLAKYEGNQ